MDIFLPSYNKSHFNGYQVSSNPHRQSNRSNTVFGYSVLKRVVSGYFFFLVGYTKYKVPVVYNQVTVLDYNLLL